MGEVLRPDTGVVDPIRTKVGGRWSHTYYVDTPADWTGYSGKAEVRTTEGATGAALATLAVDLTIPKQVTATLSSTSSTVLGAGFRGMWDLYVETGGERQYLVETSPVEIVGRISTP